MANGNFIVQNGLEVGGYKVFAGNGDIITTGNITTSGSGSINSANGFGGLNPDKVYSGTSNVHVTATNVFANIAGTKVTDVSSSGLTVVGTVTVGETTLGASTVNTGTLTAGTTNATYLDVGNNATLAGVTSITNTTNSTSTSTGALVVSGGVGIAGDVRVGGTLFVTNLQATSSTQITVQDPMLYLQANVLYPWSYDTGIFSDSIGGSANTYVHHGMVRNTSTGTWTFFSNVQSEPGSTVNWNDAGLVYDTIKTGNVIPGANSTFNLGSTTAWWGTMYGISTQAKYADLAENYQADAQYMPGQVVEFGGTNEVTLATAETTAVAGVVSTNPAHLMNGQLTGSNVVALALQGRVPCNVIGPVKKGQLMVSAGFGFAKPSTNPQVGQVIGKALQDFNGAKGQIEVVVGRF